MTVLRFGNMHLECNGELKQRRLWSELDVWTISEAVQFHINKVHSVVVSGWCGMTKALEVRKEMES